MKFVASSFIASGDLNMGVELLCVIGKGFDACRYLQIHDKWEEAARLAKSTLPEDQCNDILRRWANQLFGQGLKMKAIEIMLSMYAYMEVLKMLLDSSYDDLAALFLRSLEENGALGIIIEESQKPSSPVKGLKCRCLIPPPPPATPKNNPTRTILITVQLFI